MKAELAEVKRTVDGLTRDQLAVGLRWNDGAGTYTPPGHWNDIAAEYVRDARMSEVRAARAFALLNMAMHDAAVACWRVKYKHFNPRPSQLDPSIRTSIGLPNFPAYPSGHSTFSAAASGVLGLPVPVRGRHVRGPGRRGRAVAHLRGHPLPERRGEREGARGAHRRGRGPGRADRSCRLTAGAPRARSWRRSPRGASRPASRPPRPPRPARPRPRRPRRRGPATRRRTSRSCAA
jgi:hypothetical protein